MKLTRTISGIDLKSDTFTDWAQSLISNILSDLNITDYQIDSQDGAVTGQSKSITIRLSLDGSKLSIKTEAKGLWRFRKQKLEKLINHWVLNELDVSEDM